VIGLCIFNWVQTLPTEVTYITLDSDSCGGQSRTHNFVTLMIYIAQTNINKIAQIRGKWPLYNKG